MPAKKTTKNPENLEKPEATAPKVGKQKKPACNKTASPAVQSPVTVQAPVPVPVPAPVPENAIVPNEVSLSDQFAEFMAKLQLIANSFSSLKTEFKVLERRFARELKTAQKNSQKKKRSKAKSDITRSPSGFVKPTAISMELASFLGKTPGTEMARTEVTREINKYIREHNLQDKSNGRKINPDNKLRHLLKLKTEDELTYFNLQRYMSPHFAKMGASALADTVA